MTYVALIRGINVGGNKSIPMAKLRTIFERAGCTDVTTYIQSGNVVFRSAENVAALGAHLEAQLERAAGFHASIVLRTAAELRKVLATNPFLDRTSEGTQLVVHFFQSKPPAATYAAIDAAAFAPEAFELRGRELFLYLPGGQARSKLLEAMGKLKIKTPITARNWTTVTKIESLTRAAGAGADA